MTARGVDISVYQSTYQPKSTDDFIFVKATEGSTYHSPVHDAQVARARKAGAVVGHYHWLWPTNVPGQVANFKKYAKVQPGDIIAIDWENSSPLVPESVKDAFLKELRKEYPKNRIVVYTYTYYAPFVKAGNDTDLGDGLWIADYRGPEPKLPYLFWQYTDKPIDQNKTKFKDKAALRSWANGLNITAKPVVNESETSTNKESIMAVGEKVRLWNNDDYDLKAGEQYVKIRKGNETDVSVVVGQNDGVQLRADIEIDNPGNYPVHAFWRIVDWIDGGETTTKENNIAIPAIGEGRQVVTTYFNGVVPKPSAAKRSMRLRLVVRVGKLPTVDGQKTPPLPHINNVHIDGWKL